MLLQSEFADISYGQLVLIVAVTAFTFAIAADQYDRLKTKGWITGTICFVAFVLLTAGAIYGMAHS